MSKTYQKIKPVITVRAAKEKVFFGPGAMIILEALESAGAMKEACIKTGISYSKAWRILNDIEQQLGYPVVERQHGGQRGGGCFLTKKGREIMEDYRKADQKIRNYSEQVFEEFFHAYSGVSHEDNHSLSNALTVKKGDIVSLTGAGGKTSCLYRLGEEYKQESVLLTTTTKMKLPQQYQAEKIYSEAEYKKRNREQNPGRTFLYGKLQPDGKCTAISEKFLRDAVKDYDVVVIEADGSRALPLKGFLDNEPCIPDFASLNVGILTTDRIGKPADASFILRWKEFQEMTGIKPGEIINGSHIAKWIAHPNGMFRGSCGRKVLFWNQVESEYHRKQVRLVMDRLETSFLNSLSRVIAGSMKNGSYQLIWPMEENRE